MLNPRQINNQLSETANHRMSLTFDLAHALIGFTFAPRLYTRNVRLFVQFYICCIFAPQSEPIFDSATAIEILNGIDARLNTMDCTRHIFPFF